jgi:hypothetical protein
VVAAMTKEAETVMETEETTVMYRAGRAEKITRALF